jgi:succinyl-CoA synthetase beta subunit
MRLLEYEAKDILRKYRISIPPGTLSGTLVLATQSRMHCIRP